MTMSQAGRLNDQTVTCVKVYYRCNCISSRDKYIPRYK